ncbi:MAG: Ig-like domain-containing protein [Planctomycetota bacterium]
MKRIKWTAIVLTAGLLVPFALAQDKGLDFDPDLPPCVVKVEPANRAKDVDFRLTEIKVIFDRPMTVGENFSWIMHERIGVYPGYRGSPPPRWEDDGRTCVLPVRLSPNTLYAVGVNDSRYTGFKSLDGSAAVPFVWVFKTRE